MAFESIDPATGQRLASFPALTREQIRAALDLARDAFAEWRLVPPERRVEPLRRLAETLLRGKQAFARLMSREMGKPLAAAEAEVAKCAWVARHYADTAPAALAPEVLDVGPARCRVERHPLGAVLAVMPWNFPFWQVIRCAAPTLAAGNVILLKHAPNVPQCGIALEGLFARAGFPRGVFQNMFARVGDVPAILDDPIVQAASLTGSVGAGAALAGEAGRRVKRTVLELGGSDPFIVLSSADLDQAVSTGVAARMMNSGQSCIAAKRFLIHQDIASEFEARFVEQVRALCVGGPLDPGTEVGPLARPDIRDLVAEQVRESVQAGARLATGGRIPDRTGWYYEPTVLADVPGGCPAAEEEIFGPVASLRCVESLEEAIEVSNGTEFGCPRLFGPTTRKRPRWLYATSRPAVFSSTPCPRPIRGSRLGESRSRATVASWEQRPSASSSTSKQCGPIPHEQNQPSRI